MKILNKKIKNVETFTIDYENGVTCEVEKLNGFGNRHRRLKDYTFRNKGGRLIYVKNLDKIAKVHWSNPGTILRESIIKIKKITELYEFSDFDNLIYYGGGMDGMIRDYEGNPISSVQIIDSYSTYRGLKGNLSLDNKPDFVIGYNLEDIQVYDEEEEDDIYTKSPSLKILLSQEDYIQMFEDINNKETHFGSQCKEWVINKISDEISK